MGTTPGNHPQNQNQSQNQNQYQNQSQNQYQNQDQIYRRQHPQQSRSGDSDWDREMLTCLYDLSGNRLILKATANPAVDASGDRWEVEDFYTLQGGTLGLSEEDVVVDSVLLCAMNNVVPSGQDSLEESVAKYNFFRQGNRGCLPLFVLMVETSPLGAHIGTDSTCSGATGEQILGLANRSSKRCTIRKDSLR